MQARTAQDRSALRPLERHPGLLASEKEVLARTLSAGSSRPSLPGPNGELLRTSPAGGRRPRVSVVLSFFNEERFLRAAIATVTDQTFADWELLLVDDGSTDASAAIAAAAEAADQRLRVLRHPGGSNRGLPASRNLGLQHARADLIAFLDADDSWEPQKLERQVALHGEAPAGRDGVWHQPSPPAQWSD